MRLSRKEAKELGIEIPREDGQKKLKSARDKWGRSVKQYKGVKHDEQKDNLKLFDKLCEAHGLPLADHEYEFAKELGRKWRFDHLFDGWLAVEKDGGLYGRGPKCETCGHRPPGAHSSIAQMENDREKDRHAVLLGYAVVRFTPEEFEDGSAFVFIKRLLGSGEQA